MSTNCAKKEGVLFTYTGIEFNLANPTPDMIDIVDIATSLARQCRYNGHTMEFWSVASHSIFVASRLPPRLQLAGLLHDAAEAYTGDIATPVKRMLSGYEELEDRILLAISKRFSVDKLVPLHAKIMEQDKVAQATEVSRFIRSNNGWDLSMADSARLLPDQSMVHTTQKFLDKFWELYNGE